MAECSMCGKPVLKLELIRHAHYGLMCTRCIELASEESDEAYEEVNVATKRSIMITGPMVDPKHPQAGPRYEVTFIGYVPATRGLEEQRTERKSLSMWSWDQVLGVQHRWMHDGVQTH